MSNEIRFLLYNSPEGGENVQVLVKDETIWMTQKAISQLFDCTVDNVGLHLRNIFKEGELSEESTTEKFSVVQKEGKRNVNRELTFYNLDGKHSSYLFMSLLLITFAGIGKNRIDS